LPCSMKKTKRLKIKQRHNGICGTFFLRFHLFVFNLPQARWEIQDGNTTRTYAQAGRRRTRLQRQLTGRRQEVQGQEVQRHTPSRQQQVCGPAERRWGGVCPSGGVLMPHVNRL
jgi:hypothetical protein